MRAHLTFDSPIQGRSDYVFQLGFAAPDRLTFDAEEVRFQEPGATEPHVQPLIKGGTDCALVRFANRNPEELALWMSPGMIGFVIGNPDFLVKVVASAQVFVSQLMGVRCHHFHDTSERSAIRVTQNIVDSQRLRADGGNLAAFLFLLCRKYRAHYDRIIETVRLAVPYFLDFELAAEALNENGIMLRWRDRSREVLFGPHQLSDGSLRAMALITALLQPVELLPTVIIIDEPELGLHPHAVGLVAHLIKAVSLKRQVIVATQSPTLVREFEPEDVVVIERDEEADGRGYSRFERLSKEALGDWLKDFDLGTLYECNITSIGTPNERNVTGGDSP